MALLRQPDDKKGEQMIRRMGKTAAAALVIALLSFAAAPQARADERDRCRRNIEKAEVRLDRAIQRHGERSPAAEERRLRAVRWTVWD
jgi:hypothetical protein